MPKTVSGVSNSQNNLRLFQSLAALLVIILGGWWWHIAHQSSTQVFWDMMNNNLVTASVTKHDVQTTQGTSTNQYTQLQFGMLNAAHGLSTVKQQATTVVSETIGTSKNDYSRYLSIKTSQKTTSGKTVDASKFTGIWGKTSSPPAGQPASVQYFQQGVLGVVPFGNFTSSQRHNLIKLMQSDKTYSLGTINSTTDNGQAVYVYMVNISPAGLISVLQQYAKDLGLGDIGLDPSQYAGSATVEAQFTVAKLSHQLMKVHYVSNNQDETYTSQGLEQPVTLPAKTIPIADLQNRVEQSLQ